MEEDRDNGIKDSIIRVEADFFESGPTLTLGPEEYTEALLPLGTLEVDG